MEALVQKLQTTSSPGPDRVIAGAVIGSATKTRNPHTVAVGTTSVELSAPALKDDAVMWAASCTKLVTTVAALQCVEKGLFTLDEPISRLLPKWSSPDIMTGFDVSTGEPILEKAKNPITPRQLLTHSSARKGG